ncbi:MAG: cytochrome c peroxidase [Flavobacteriales bacterium]
MNQWLFIFISLILLGCSDVPPLKEDGPYRYKKPSFFPEYQIPEDNKPTVLRVELGRRLFFEKRLSNSNSTSCASCHVSSMAFTDGKSISHGAHGRMGNRNAPTLANLLWSPHLMSEGGVKTLELQALGPIQDSSEMDMTMRNAEAQLADDVYLQNLSQAAYGRPLDAYVMIRALAVYQRSFISGDTRFDKYHFFKDTTAFNAQEKRGYDIFFSEKAACASCHQLPFFTDYKFYNIGLYENYADAGRQRVTYTANDNGKFKTPTLRNIEMTPPYMHDGSIRTLEDVVEFYNWGGKSHPNKDARIQKMNWTPQEKADLIAFLKTLTDWNFLQNHNFLPLQ